jgi:5'-methylthioadenosine phosphorylase
LADWVLGVIGGSGLYEIDGLENRRWVKIDSPWGQPSDEVLMGEIGGVRLVFLPRHGRGHRLPPSAINARANIDALKRAGCTDILSVSAVGSLREDLAPASFIVADQYIDHHSLGQNRSSMLASSPMYLWQIQYAPGCHRSRLEPARASD